MFASSSVQQQQQALVASARLNNLHAHNKKSGNNHQLDSIQYQSLV
jgi:hypothetical protein